MTNKLFYGDNLGVLREQVGNDTVDLVYLDPPFNSNATYNILFKSPSGDGASASIEAFDDTWSWGPAAQDALLDIIGSGNTALVALLSAIEKFIGQNALMAYLVMMSVRLVELHRTLKSTGSLYLHCDPTASHYLKLVLDAVFGAENYQAEIIWRRTNSRSTAGKWPRLHDVILHYSKSPQAKFNQQTTLGDAGKVPHTLVKWKDGLKYNTFELTGAGVTKEGESGKPWRGFNPAKMGRHWGYSVAQLEEWVAGDLIHFPGNGGFPRRRAETPFDAANRMVTVGDVWTDIDRLNQTAKERLRYPTQKPIALLERIIAASSNAGDLVLDPFCGCGTAVDAAHKLGRRWIGIDVTHLAVGLIEKRMREGYPGIQFETIGVPADLESAQRLAAEKPHDFQNWICLRLGGYPWMGGKKGGDKGVDGYFYYFGDDRTVKTGVISVKAGQNVTPGMVRDLGGVMTRDGHDLGLFVCAAKPTKGMTDEANSNGVFETHFGGSVGAGQRYPRLQIFTLAELFDQRSPKLPPLVSPNQRAQRVETRPSHKVGAQPSLI